MANGLNPIPTWGHTTIHKSQGVRVAIGMGALDFLDPLPPLGGIIDFKRSRTHARRFGPKEQRLHGLEVVFRWRGLRQDLAEILMDCSVIVNDVREREETRNSGQFVDVTSVPAS
jgi:hypothetical protein